MYVPRHQYTVKKIQNTEGRVQYEDGTPYRKGTFVEMSNGDCYEVPESDLKQGNFSRAKKLVVAFAATALGVGATLLTSYLAKKRAGTTSIKRYFIHHKPTDKIIEVSEEDYRAEIQSPVAYKQGFELDWQIAGPIEDTVIGGFPYQGVVSRNKKAVDDIAQVIPAAKTYITDFKFLAESEESTEIFEKPVPDRFYIPSPSNL